MVDVGFATRFPRDIQREILLRLPYDDILYLCKDQTFAWISKDADYWAARANVERRVFAESIGTKYHWIYLNLRYGDMVARIIQNTLERYESIVGYVHWANVFYTVIFDPLVSPDAKCEFALYVFSVCDQWKRIINENLYTVAKHPKILKFLASTGVRLTMDTRGALVAAYENGGMSAVHWLESIADIDWDNTLKVGAYWHLELLRYVAPKGGQEALGVAYIDAIRGGYKDAAEYLEPLVGGWGL